MDYRELRRRYIVKMFVNSYFITNRACHKDTLFLNRLSSSLSNKI